MFLILPTISSPSYNRSCPSVLTVKSRANGRRIVGQQLPTLLDVTCCVRLHTPLHVVACCWEMLRKVWNLSNFEPTTPNISFDQWLPKYIMVRLHSSSSSAGATHANYKWSTKSSGSNPSHDAVQVPTIIRLHTIANTDATTPNIYSKQYLLAHCWPNFIVICSRVYNEPIQRPAPSWLVSLIGRALHRYRRGQGFESRTSLNFFQAFFSQLQKLRI